MPTVSTFKLLKHRWLFWGTSQLNFRIISRSVVNCSRSGIGSTATSNQNLRFQMLLRKFWMDSAIEKPINKVTQTQLVTSRSVKTSCASVSALPATPSATQRTPSASSSARPTANKTLMEINWNQHSKSVIKKYKTKFSSVLQ